jgi:NADPH:quinone reductase-like Zn-dependent oxidoreductase
VDVVLNSLTGESIPASVSCLAKNGIFIEIGKRDIWTLEQFNTERQSAAYHIVDLMTLTETEPERMSSIFAEVMGLIRTGELKPLPIQSFSFSQVTAAFRFMAQALHTGKIVLTNHRYQVRGLLFMQADCLDLAC